MVCDTPPSQDVSTHQIWNSYLKEYRRYALDTQLWYTALSHPKMHLHTKSEIPTSNNMIYAPDRIILKTRSEVKVKVTVTRKWYLTLRHPKMYPHTKFGIPSSKNIGDMHRTQSGTDGLTDGRTVRLLYASQSSFGCIKIIILWSK